jgi:hypothetical protein
MAYNLFGGGGGYVIARSVFAFCMVANNPSQLCIMQFDVVTEYKYHNKNKFSYKLAKDTGFKVNTSPSSCHILG